MLRPLRVSATHISPLAHLPRCCSIHTKAYPHGVYITHYKEMGHQYDSMEYCRTTEPNSQLLPLADYVDSAAVLREMKAAQRMEQAIREWSRRHQDRPRSGGSRVHGIGGGARPSKPATALNFTMAAIVSAPWQPSVFLVEQERNPMEVQKWHLSGRCEPNVTFGGLYFQGRPYLWVKHLDCHGIFVCAGTKLRCGLVFGAEHARLYKARTNGREWLKVCTCDKTEGLDANRHRRDGHDHLANGARCVGMVEVVRNITRR